MIHINDVNDNPPAFNSPLYQADMEEEMPGPHPAHLLQVIHIECPPDILQNPLKKNLHKIFLKKIVPSFIFSFSIFPLKFVHFLFPYFSKTKKFFFYRIFILETLLINFVIHNRMYRSYKRLFISLILQLRIWLGAGTRI